MRIAVFDCHAGVAGDMTVGALIDAGLDIKLIQSELDKLKIPYLKVSQQKVRRGALSGMQFKVSPKASFGKAHIHYAELEKIIQSSRLHADIRKQSLRMLKEVTRVEARMHGKTLRSVALHDVGAADSVADIVSVAIGFHHLGIKKAFARNLCLGSGQITVRGHGKLGVPVPATVELLKGFDISYVKVGHELVTPTGAVILKCLADKSETIPLLNVSATGFGAGTRELKDRSNMLRLTLGDAAANTLKKDRVLLLETNLDDMNPQGFELLYRRLLQAGALDVFVLPILMKKMRPAYKLSILLEHAKHAAIASVLFEASTTLGCRLMEVDRLLLERKTISVKTTYGTVRVKIGSLDGERKLVAPEYDDCKLLAEKRDVSFEKMYRDLKRQAERLAG